MRMMIQQDSLVADGIFCAENLTLLFQLPALNKLSVEAE